MRRAKKKSDEPYIKPPHGVQLLKAVIPANTSVAAVGKQAIQQQDAATKNNNQNAPGITITRDLDKLKTISISAFNLDKLIIHKKEEKESEKDVSHLPKDEFDAEKLLTVWRKYAAKLQSSGKESLYVTLSNRHPQILDNFNIGFIIDNKVQEQDIEKEKPELMEFIRKELNNFSVQLHLTHTTGDETQLLYTSRDKFKKLAEKNPHLLTMKQRFNLDLEF